jgi:hypothetical protein
MTEESACITDLEGSRMAFATTGLAVMRKFLSPALSQRFCELVDDLRAEGMRKDFAMPQSGSTPRNMTVVGGATMNAQPEIMELYRNTELREQISTIVGRQIVDCSEQVENVIATVLDREGDTHGWHLDDYPVALIMCLRAPPPGQGGDLEMERAGGVECLRIEPRDAYLLRSDRIRHRVAPIMGGTSRVILNFTYGFEGAHVHPNGSAYLLCA